MNQFLNYVKAREIRKKYKETNMTQRELATEYDVHINTIRGVLSNKSWKEDYSDDRTKSEVQ